MLVIATVYVLEFGAAALFICIIVPQLIQNLKTFTESADEYLPRAQDVLNQMTAAFRFRSIDLISLIETVNQYLCSFSNAINNILSQLIKAASNVIPNIAATFNFIVLNVHLYFYQRKKGAEIFKYSDTGSQP